MSFGQKRVFEIRFAHLLEFEIEAEALVLSLNERPTAKSWKIFKTPQRTDRERVIDLHIAQ